MPENFNPVRDAQPGPYVQSLLSFLEEHTAGPNFKLYDWLRTLDFDMLAATDSGNPPTERARLEVEFST